MKLNDMVWNRRNPNISLMALSVGVTESIIICIIQYMCPYKSEGIINKEFFSSPKITRVAGVSFIDLLLVFTNVAYDF